MSQSLTQQAKTVALLTTIVQISTKTLQIVGGNEIALPPARDVLEDVSAELKEQLDGVE